MANNLLIYAGCEEKEEKTLALLTYRGVELGEWFMDSAMLEEMFRSPRIIIDTIPSTWYV